MLLSIGKKHVALIALAVLCGVFESMGHMAQWGITLPFHMTAGLCLAMVTSLGLLSKDIRDLPTNAPINASTLVAELPAAVQAATPVLQTVSAPKAEAIAPSVVADMAPVLDELKKAGAK